MNIQDYYRHTILSSVSNPQYVFNNLYYNSVDKGVKKPEKPTKRLKVGRKTIDMYV